MKTLKEILDFGIIVIDKPTGPTSHEVTASVAKKLGIKKASPMGILDPAVTGVLPITFNRACRLSPYLLGKSKKYVGIMRLHADIETGALKEVMHEFVGQIEQLPPVRSNVKRAVRKREVYSFTFIEREDKDVLFFAHVEGGTYIRTLVNDLGKRIGGAHMLELRRTCAGIFEESGAVTLYELDNALEALAQGNEKPLRKIILSAQEVLKEIMPTVQVKKEPIVALLRGKPLHKENISASEIQKLPEKGKEMALFSKDVFIGCYRMVLEKDVLAVPEFVFN